MGCGRGTRRIVDATAGALTHIVAPAFGCHSRPNVGARRVRSRGTDGGCLCRQRGVEPTCFDRRPESLAGHGARAPSAAGPGWATAAPALRCPGQHPTPHFRPLHLAAKRATGFVSTLSRPFTPPGFRFARHSDPTDVA